jgi:hypothetical protein
MKCKRNGNEMQMKRKKRAFERLQYCRYHEHICLVMLMIFHTDSMHV